MHKIKPYLIGAVAGILFIVIGAGGAYVVYKKTKPLMMKAKTKLSDMRFNSVKKATQEVKIADFETPEDFQKFNDSNVDVALSKEFATSGTYCAKVTFKAGQAPSFRIDKYFEKNTKMTNWASYGSFLFDIYNPYGVSQRLILQIKDSRGERHKRDIILEPHAKETIEVEISRLRHAVSIYRIAQINLFRWEPQKDAVFYIDNYRLVPQGAKTKKTIFDDEFTKSKEPVYAAGDYFAFSKAPWQHGIQERIFPIRVINQLPLHIRNLPARGGLPFPKGELLSADFLDIRRPDGKRLPIQKRTMALWPDGSIKWLLVDMPISADSMTAAEYAAVYPVKNAPLAYKPMIREDNQNFVVNTGRVVFLVNKTHFRLFDKVWVRGRTMVSEGSDMTLLFRGRTYRSSLDQNVKVTMEENGPLVAGLKAEGWFVAPNKQKFCKFIVRIKAYRGESFVRVFHTFIYTGYPENQFHYLYKGRRLPKNEPVEEISLDVRIPEIMKSGELTFAADGKVAQVKNMDRVFNIIQVRDDQYEVFKNRKEEIGSGKQLEGWFDVSRPEHGGVSVAVRKLWQQYPKGFEVDPAENALLVKLWPQEAGPLDLKTSKNTPGPEDVARGSAFGLGKTHELIFYFHENNYKAAKSRAIGMITQEPPLVTADPSWFSRTRVMGAVADSARIAKIFPQYENSLDLLFGWGDRQKKTFRWYGMLDFGDTMSWYRNSDGDNDYDGWGWHPVGRWGWFNCEGVGTHMGALLQFLRTGQYKYFEFGEDLSRHLMDVDTCHYNTVNKDKRLRHIFEDYSRPGSMHRHSGDHWGGRNEEASHTNLNGILLYYYITGNDRAFDVAKEVGQFFLRHPIVYFKHPDIAPNRGMANILMGEVALYEATQDPRYKEDADYWANMFFQGQNRNGSFNEDYNPADKRWDGDPHLGYMSGYDLPALIDYHKLTGNHAIKSAIVKLVEYLAKHDEYGAISEGLAYAYYLTGDSKFLQIMEQRLNAALGSQRTGEDPLWNGMIYQKLYYARLVEFLYFTPYAFEALLAEAQPKSESVNSR